MNILYIVDMITVMGECEKNTVILANEMAKSNRVSILTNHFNSNYSNMLKNIDLYVGFNDENYRKLCDKNINVVHSCPVTAVDVGYKLSDMYNANHIVSVYGNNTAGLTPEIIRNCNNVIFLSEEYKEDSKELIPEDKCVVIPTIVDAIKYKEKMVILKNIKNLYK